MSYFRRRSLQPWEEIAAMAAGAAAGLVTTYLFRTWLKRDPIGDEPAPRDRRSPGPTGDRPPRRRSGRDERSDDPAFPGGERTTDRTR